MRKGEGLVRLMIRGGRTSSEKERRVELYAMKVSPADFVLWTAN
jgi:hypothetical protein